MATAKRREQCPWCRKERGSYADGCEAAKYHVQLVVTKPPPLSSDKCRWCGFKIKATARLCWNCARPQRGEAEECEACYGYGLRSDMVTTCAVCDGKGERVREHVEMEPAKAG